MLRVALDLAHARQSAAGTARVARSLARALAARDDVTVLQIGDGALLARDDPRRRALALYQDLAWYPVLGRRAARGVRTPTCTTCRWPADRCGAAGRRSR